MTDLEVFKLSAEGCDKQRVRISSALECIYDEPYLVWNPFTNAEQRWQCVEKLLALGKDLTIDSKGEHWVFPYSDNLIFKCPASEFPARALAELQRRKTHD